MLVNGKPYQAIWFDNEQKKVFVIDQRKLPYEFTTMELASVEDCYAAIKNMAVRGAPLIGVTAAYGIYLAVLNSTQEITFSFLSATAQYLKLSRPTAVNLENVVDTIIHKLYLLIDEKNVIEKALNFAIQTEQTEIENCSKIGNFGLDLIEQAFKKSGKKTVNILTHCNAGWLACVDWGTALAPIYKAHLKGIPVHVWVDETRPRNQGARLTAWELQSAGVACTVIPDNTGGHLMQHNKVDMVMVGSDRTTRNGDVANKIGTYLKALAAFDNQIPFFVALPSTTIDFKMQDGIKNIPIEERDVNEIRMVEGLVDGKIKDVLIIPDTVEVANYGFDVTPAKFVTRLITERGICGASEKDILALFPEFK